MELIILPFALMPNSNTPKTFSLVITRTATPHTPPDTTQHNISVAKAQEGRVMLHSFESTFQRSHCSKNRGPGAILLPSSSTTRRNSTQNISVIGSECILRWARFTQVTIMVAQVAALLHHNLNITSSVELLKQIRSRFFRVFGILGYQWRRSF